MTLSFKNRIIKNLEIDGVDHRDYPDYCDAYFSHAEYENGTWLTESELEELRDVHGDVLHEMAFESTVEAAEFAHDLAMDR